jgi:hypothetical protein
MKKNTPSFGHRKKQKKGKDEIEKIKKSIMAYLVGFTFFYGFNR